MFNFRKIIDTIIKYQLFLTVGIFALSAIALIFNLWWFLSRPASPLNIENQSSSAGADTSELAIASRINGLPVIAGSENLYPAAVTIDNHFDAWPIFGLNQAAVVYETLAEGSATRLLAIFTPSNENMIEKIGPVRSTRPYFLEIVKEYDALHAHSGGSPTALQMIETMKIHNLEEIAWWGPDYFWRVYSRQAPHNLFTSSGNLAKAVVDWELGNIVPDYRPWRFSDPLENQDNLPPAEKISIAFSAALVYNVNYTYSTTTGEYLRFQGGEPMLDGLDQEQIAAADVVIQFVSKEKLLDAAGRVEINLIGSGDVWVLRDGKIIKGKWKKVASGGRTVFYDESGEEIFFKPGLIFVEIVPGDRQVTVE